MSRRRSLVSSDRPMPLWFRKVALWILAMFGLAAAFLVIGVTWRIARAWSDVSWFGGEPFRILYIHGGSQTADASALRLVNVWPDTYRVVELELPADVHVDAVGGYGNYRLGALVPLGKVEKVGNRLLVDSIEFEIGVPIHHVVVRDEDAKVKNDWGLISRQVIQEGLTGKRAFSEALAIRTLLSRVEEASVERIVLSEKNVLREREAVGGGQLKYFEPALLDRFNADHLSGIWKDAASLQVAVINATGKPQMAGLWSRLARTGGYDVVNVTDQPELEQQSKIVFSSLELEKSPAGLALLELYPHAVVSVGDAAKYRADVAVLIGLNAWEWLNQRQAYLGEK